MAATGRISVTSVRAVGIIQSTHQYDVTVKFEIAFNYGGWNTSGASYTVSCDGQSQNGSTTFSIGSGGGSWVWATIATKTFRVTMPSSGQSKTINFSAGINTGISPSYISASGSYTLPAVTWQWNISYNANGGSGAPGTQTKKYGTSLTLSSTKPTRTGYTFLGWATSSTATSATYSAGGTYTANSGATLYAVWKINTYTVSYDANGGSGAPDSQTKTYGTNLTLSDVIPIRSNYNLKGLATTNTATTATYAAGGVYTENAKVTLYAVWELAYWIPKIKSINIARCDTNGTMDSYGTCAKISFDWECCQITGVNNISSITIGYVLSDPASVTNVNVPVSGISGSVSKVIGSDQLSTDDQYTIIITAKDSKNGVSSAEIVLSKSSFTMDILAGGKGIAIGKPAEDENLFDVGWDLKARKEVYDKFGSRICNGLASYIGTGDDGIDPDTTVDQLVITDKNVPVNGLAYVESMFFDKKSTDTNRSQIAVPYSAEDSLYHRHYYNGSWSEWRRANVVDQKVLWNGAYYLTSNQTAVLSEPISAQSNGIMLVFADLDSSGNGEESWAAQQGYWAYFIPKQAVADFSGRFWTCSTQWWSAIAPQLVIKGFYVTDTKITGHSISVTKTDTVNGTRSVLRRIYGV